MTATADLAIGADYARLVWPFVCREQTRYMLAGFYVQPHKSGGALIVATDGHSMAIFHDAEGQVVTPGIVRLSRTTLAACRTPLGQKGETVRRVLSVDGSRASVYRHWQSTQDRGRLVAAEDDAVIDGTFPDWRRVVPEMPQTFGSTAMNSSYLRRFERISRNGKPTPVSVYAKNATDPIVVLTERDDFLGIVMPMRVEHHYPAWL